MKNLYYIQDRWNTVLYHFLYYMICGLADIKEESKPIYFSLPIYKPNLGIEDEILELLKPDFEYVEDISGFNIINIFGTMANDENCIAEHYNIFLRNQILIKNNLQIKNTPFRYIYISRNKSSALMSNAGCFKRNIINEKELYENVLTKYNFEFIYLEDYSFKEKIKIFQEAKVIISPCGGALSMSAFANENTQIIEITTKIILNNQFIGTCRGINIKYVMYYNVDIIPECFNNSSTAVSAAYNFRIRDFEDFENFIKKYL